MSWSQIVKTNMELGTIKLEQNVGLLWATVIRLSLERNWTLNTQIYIWSDIIVGRVKVKQNNTHLRF